MPFRDVGPDNPPDGSRPLILPGVGAFGPVMQHLRATKLDEPIVRLVQSGTPYLGICIGMQILFEDSAESPGTKGLELVSGSVVRFTSAKVPQIGWNEIMPKKSEWESGYVYFVNSYYPQPTDASSVLYEANYGAPFCAAIQTGSITAFQFHPEKSGPFGKRVLQRWLENV